MTIKLKKKPLSTGKLSLYLDSWDGEQRQYEFLKLYLYPRPKDPLEKEHNSSRSRPQRTFGLSVSYWPPPMTTALPPLLKIRVTSMSILKLTSKDT
ncbi:Arm DNA-binding domain-containing protein [Fibrella forsythiae]|uniref:Arm DNA-binding domain-containing protein n=1 Tax=Fibrella forsythiae TaxID=2817061 RepID=A0ABS3JDY8_9BACT|nr:hypothetical protein [Fibrella forsythiae]